MPQRCQSQGIKVKQHVDKLEIILSVHTPTRSPRFFPASCVENEACSGFQVTLIRSDELKLNASITVTW